MRAAVTMTLALLCASCVLKPPIDDAQLMTLPVLPATAATPPPETLYSVRTAQGSEHHDVLVVLSRQGDSFTLHGISEIGLTLFQWPGIAPHAHSWAVPGSADPELVVRLLQLAQWPLADWQRVLTDSLWRLTAPTAVTRVLLYGGHPVVTVARTAAGGLTLRACLYGELRSCAAQRRLAIDVTQLAGGASPTAPPVGAVTGQR